MKISQCSHVRIRDSNEYGINVEKFIESIEKQYKIDFKSIPQWKKLIEQLHAATTEGKRILAASKYRKTLIINKIFTENTRPSPFELTENLYRTSKVWDAMKLKCKNPKLSLEEAPEDSSPYADKFSEISGELSESKFTAHPNTEIMPSEDLVEQQLFKSEVATETNLTEASHLPVNICINQHRMVSPLCSNESYLSYKSLEEIPEVISESEPKEWLFLEPTSYVNWNPKEITVTNATLKEQCLTFAIVNCTTEYLHLRFKDITDKSPFKKIKIFPATPVKVYPGISVTFKITFTLVQTEEFTPLNLYFRVGQNIISENSIKALLIPIVSKFKFSRSISVPKTVTIAPAYSWHVNKKIGFPTGIVTISNNDNCGYHLHVIKRFYDFAKDSADSLVSVDVFSPNTESIQQRTDDNEIKTHSKMFSPSKGDTVQTVTEVESLKTIDAIALVVDEIVDLALEAFVFKHTYLYLHPHSTRKIPVYFTKAEHTGFHQCYYDFELFEQDTEEFIRNKTVQIYAEILPHPVKIYPNILDMSTSPIAHGYCEDTIKVTNTHKVYPVTVKVKLTSKMKKLFHVTPVEVEISAQSYVNFYVRVCSRSLAPRNVTEDLVHFTIKLVFSGHASVYYNVPPFFYEIIAPCAFDFKKIYSDKFFFELPEKSKQEMSNDLVKSSLRFAK